MNTKETPKEKGKKKGNWRSVFALSAAAFVDSSENETLSILWPHIYPSMRLSVGQLGTVLGISDMVRTLTLPLWGYAADRFSRKALLVWITGFWGVWTLAIALTHSLTQLLIVRIVSSLGLGVLWPTAFSLLSDLFDRKERGRAAGIMTGVSYAGSIVSFGILPAIAAISPESWRWGFVVMGLASVATGFLLMIVKDPPRGSAEPELTDVITDETALRYTFHINDLPAITKVKSWWVLVINNCFEYIAMAVLYGWIFTWLDGLGLGDSAFFVVGVMALGTIIGLVAFGWLGDVLDARYPNHGRASMAMIGMIVSIPALVGLIYYGDRGITTLMIFGLLCGISLSSIDTGARWPIGQGILRPELRATGRAVMDMSIGIVGALSITISGRLVDNFGGDVTRMLLLMIPIPKIISTLIWIPMFRTYPKDRNSLHDLLEERREEMIASAEE